jgi:hypothetical protein
VKLSVSLHFFSFLPIILDEGIIIKSDYIPAIDMGRRARISLLVAALVVLGAAYTVVRASDHDPLWQKAVKIASANDNWVPGYVVHREEVYSRIGIRQEKTITHSQLRRHEKPDVEVTFLTITQNGKDITEEFTSEFGRTVILEEDEYRVDHPFKAYSLGAVEYERLDKIKNIDGHRCIAYEFSYIDKRGTWKGTAWLEEESGVPRFVEGKLVSVPFEEGWYTLLGLEVATSFTTSDNGSWYPERAIVDSRIEVVIKLFQSYRGRVKETYTFSKHWRYD